MNLTIDSLGAASARVGVMTGVLRGLGVKYTSAGSPRVVLKTNTPTGDKTIFDVTGNTDIPISEFIEALKLVSSAASATAPTDNPDRSLPVVQAALTATASGGTQAGTVLIVAIVAIG